MEKKIKNGDKLKTEMVTKLKNSIGYKTQKLKL